MTINKFAPVLIPTLNRYEHFKRCVESLSNCTHAGNTDLFIALDYPLNESHWEGYQKIDEYVKTITGFKSITIIRRDVNYGASNNIRDAIEKIFDQYDRLIFSEDDNEFSKTFLVFINAGLEKYEDNKDIYFICGYNYPIKIPDYYQYDVFFWKGYSAWGVGIWKEKWHNIDWSIDNLKEFLIDPVNVKLIHSYSDILYRFLKNIVLKNKTLGDAMIAYNLLKYKKYCVFPKISKVRNFGHDGSGIHCGKNNIYNMQNIDNNNEPIKFTDIVEENNKINMILKRYFSNKIFFRIIRKIKKIIMMYKK